MNERHKSLIADHFTRHAADWKIIYEKGQDRFNEFYSKNIQDRKTAVLALLDEFAHGRHLKILDAGCGPGIFLEEALKRGHSVVGLDISYTMLTEARVAAKGHQAERAKFVQGDIERMPFEDGAFDAVLCIGVLSYLRKDESSIAEISRVVCTGGLVIIALPNLLRLNVWLDPYYYVCRIWRYLFRKITAGDHGVQQTACIPEAESDSIDSLLRKYHYHQLSGLFQAHNLIKHECKGVGYGPLTFWGREVLSTGTSLRISRFMETMASGKWFSPARYFANHWVFALIKQRS